MFNLEVIKEENNAEYNSKWSYIKDNPYKILLAGGSGSEKTNVLLRLITKEDSDVRIYKVYLYT